MHTTPIRAIDRIVIDAPAAAIWRVVSDVGRYPQWWPRSLGVRVCSFGTEAIGAEIEIRPVGGRPFRCRVEEVDELKRMRLRYYGGFIEGTGEWWLEPGPDGNQVSYDLDVIAHGRLVGLIGRFISLERLHSRPMQCVLLNLKRAAQ